MNTNPVSAITIATREPARIMTRLCKHWGHKFPVDLQPDHARVELSLGEVRFEVRPDGLHVQLQGKKDTDMLRFEQVLAEHAQRMARDEQYEWHWQRS